MDRRLFFGIGIALVEAPLRSRAQPAKAVPRLGVLLFSSPDSDPNYAAFRQGLAELGLVEGTHIEIVDRSAEGRPERLPSLAAELVGLKPDVIFALGGDVAPFVLTATKTIPVVMAVSFDPVAAGLIASFAKPGGNVTGVTFASSELAAKRLQFLQVAMPAIARVAVLWNPDHVDPEYRETQLAGRALGIRVQSLEVRRPADFDTAFAAAVAERAEAIVVVSARMMTLNRQRILDFAARLRLPVVAGWGPWAESGALLSYGPDVSASVKRAARHVDGILKGARPGELAVEQPTKLDLMLSRKTAAALGVSIPQTLLLRADKVFD